ncbi:MAG: 1-deoxy-D-xylulose-5-phosphate reductoisomerase [Bacteroidetes bacterium]|nr:MAG: 1-deoxy-D-xylulose-5-phosphate reductoisomerase [Bacteroidota bacterium]
MSQEKKGVAILGSTGSIGKQALEVIEEQRAYFSVELLSAHNNADLLIRQAKKFQPNIVVITEEKHYQYVKNALWEDDIKVYAGIDALCQAVQTSGIHIVLTALVGYAGLKPTIAAIEGKKQIALANKETLVVAGEMITRMARENGVNIYPVDSEHSAIFQCLTGEFHNPVEKIYLTASGGPFRGRKKEDLAKVTKSEALKHPNWSMGQKITIDSATLMNKGLEVIEAKWLFGLKPEQIDVIIHPQSIVHSVVQFQDGSMKAQMGLPDMKLPIQYALTYPVRLPSNFPRFNFMDYPQLTFEQPDKETFKNLQLAYDAMEQGGNKPCILNAANEVAVQLFLNDKISFLEIAQLNEQILNSVPYIEKPQLEDYIWSDEQAREQAFNLI